MSANSFEAAEESHRLPSERVTPDIWQSGDLGAPARLLKTISLAKQMIGYRSFCYLFCHLWILKFVFNFLRPLRPIAALNAVNLMILTKASDVREVLDRFNDFALGEVIEPGMPWGPFIMTVDWEEQHRVERELLQSVVKRTIDQQLIKDAVAEECRSRIGNAVGQIDVVADLAEPAVLRIVKDYFGVSPIKGDERLMARATRDLAGIIMVGPPAGSQPWINSRDSIANVTAQLMEQIESARSKIAAGKANELPDTLLTRLTVLLCSNTGPKWFDEDWIRRYLTGLVGTGAATIVRGFTQMIDQLVSRPEALLEARKLAARINQNEADGRDDKVSCEALRQYIYEALRFRPMLPLLVRDSPRETIVASGTPRARLVPAGTRVLAAPLAAMFDPLEFPDPERFDPKRPIENYIHFGHGPRHCFGRYVADVALMEMTLALLSLPDLERAGGSSGHIRFEGPAPCSFTLKFSDKNAGAQDR